MSTSQIPDANRKRNILFFWKGKKKKNETNYDKSSWTKLLELKLARRQTRLFSRVRVERLRPGARRHLVMLSC